MSEKKEIIIKMIKLTSNEVIVAEIVSNMDSGLKIRHPLLVAVNRYQNSGDYYIGDFMPMSKDEAFIIYYKDIMAVVNPEDHLRDVWVEMTSIKPVTNINLH